MRVATYGSRTVSIFQKSAAPQVAPMTDGILVNDTDLIAINDGGDVLVYTA
jgi:hypothetical protein